MFPFMAPDKSGVTDMTEMSGQEKQKATILNFDFYYKQWDILKYEIYLGDEKLTLENITIEIIIGT